MYRLSSLLGWKRRRKRRAGEVCRSGEGMWDRGTGTGGMGKVCGERGGGV